MNKVIDGKQYTILFHVDGLKISYKDPRVVDDVITTLQSIFGKVTVSRGAAHTYVDIHLDFSVAGELSASMINYFQSTVDIFPEKLYAPRTPAATFLFSLDSCPFSLLFHLFSVVIST